MRVLSTYCPLILRFLLPFTARSSSLDGPTICLPRRILIPGGERSFSSSWEPSLSGDDVEASIAAGKAPRGASGVRDPSKPVGRALLGKLDLRTVCPDDDTDEEDDWVCGCGETMCFSDFLRCSFDDLLRLENIDMKDGAKQQRDTKTQRKTEL